MAYVRTHGNQVSIVLGARHPETGKVEQQVLFTFYSKVEVLEALGRGSEGGDIVFCNLLQHHHPCVQFNWEKLHSELEARLDVLPDLYPYRSASLRDQFRADLVAFARQLLTCDPDQLLSYANLAQEQHQELEYIADLIRRRVSRREQIATEWNRDTSFHWLHRMQGSSIPADAVEEIAELYRKGDHDRVQSLAQLFVECFPSYAEGHNYLGLVALARGDLDEAADHFRRAIEVGRTLFPRRPVKAEFVRHPSTQPYLEGLSNLIDALNRAGKFDEALDLCDLLDRERGDYTATAYRVDIWLNLGRWTEALEGALKGVSDWPEYAFRVAFARYEIGEVEEALYWFIYGALRLPRTAWMLVEKKVKRPYGWTQPGDHLAGVQLVVSLQPYLARRTPAARALLRLVMADPEIAAIAQDVDQHADESPAERAARGGAPPPLTAGFARAKAKELLTRMGAAAGTRKGTGPGSRSHRKPRTI